MTDKTPEALELADWCEQHSSGIYRPSAEAAALLRSQHQRIEELEKALRNLLDALKERPFPATVMQAEKELGQIRAAAPQPPAHSEQDRHAAAEDARLLGTGFLVDGHRIDPARVQMLTAPSEQRKPLTDSEVLGRAKAHGILPERHFGPAELLAFAASITSDGIRSTGGEHDN